MLQIWLPYDFYILVCAYIVAKPYVRFTNNTCTHEKLGIIQKKLDYGEQPNTY